MSSSVLVPQASFGLGPVFSPPASPGAMVVDANNNGDSSSSSSSDDCSPVRPDLSYAHLAALAIDASGQKRCTVGEIYAWIEARYPYFKSGCPWWKNCIRHNLSMKKSFIRVQGEGANLWAINPAHYDDLLRSKRRRSSSGASRSQAPSSSSPTALSSASSASIFLSLPSPQVVPASPNPVKNITIVGNTLSSSTTPEEPSSPSSSPLFHPLPALPARERVTSPKRPAGSSASIVVASSTPATASPDSPPRKRPSTTPRVPRSPRVRRKRLDSLNATSEMPPPGVQLRAKSMEEIWLGESCRSPSPTVFGLGAFSTPMGFAPISSLPRVCSGTTPTTDLGQGDPNWFYMDYAHYTLGDACGERALSPFGAYITHPVD